MPDWLKPLLGVAIGWLLGVLTELWRETRQNRRRRSAIYSELRDVQSAIKTRLLAIEATLKRHIRGQVPEHFPTGIENPIFNRWFAESAAYFSESERLALTHIYSHLDSLNWTFGVIRDNWDLRNSDGSIDNERLRRVISLTEGAYRASRETELMIELLLRDKSDHNIRDPANEAQLLQLDEQTGRDLQRWIREAGARNDSINANSGGA